MNSVRAKATRTDSTTVTVTVTAIRPDEKTAASFIPSNGSDRPSLTHLFRVLRAWVLELGRGPSRRWRPSGTQATKYLALGWWQMMAVVDCSGWSWNPSLTSTPMRSASSIRTTVALSSRSGQAG